MGQVTLTRMRERIPSHWCCENRGFAEREGGIRAPGWRPECCCARERGSHPRGGGPAAARAGAHHRDRHRRAAGPEPGRGAPPPRGPHRIGRGAGHPLRPLAAAGPGPPGQAVPAHGGRPRPPGPRLRRSRRWRHARSCARSAGSGDHRIRAQAGRTIVAGIEALARHTPDDRRQGRGDRRGVLRRGLRRRRRAKSARECRSASTTARCRTWPRSSRSCARRRWWPSPRCSAPMCSAWRPSPTATAPAPPTCRCSTGPDHHPDRHESDAAAQPVATSRNDSGRSAE